MTDRELAAASRTRPRSAAMIATTPAAGPPSRWSLRSWLVMPRCTYRASGWPIDSLTTVRNAITSWPTRPSTSAIWRRRSLPWDLRRAASGMRPMLAQASQARISMRRKSSNRCWSAQTARIAGGEYRSINKAPAPNEHWGQRDYTGARLRADLVETCKGPQDA